jgi:undecaprenyl-diphosphatase
VSFFDAVVLGLVQGLTEFLPVSSSGHLVMAQTFLGIPAPGVFLEVALHVATLLSVAVVYRRRLAELAVGAVRRDREALRYLGLLVLATVPVGLIGYFFEDAIEVAFDTPAVTGFMLLLTGFILWSTTWGSRERTHDQPRTGHAIAMGFAQCLALLPGVSRSGSTIAAGLWTGVKGERAAEFSFLMSLPAVGGAAVLQAVRLEGQIVVTPPLATALLVSLMAGIVAIKSLVWLVRRQGFHHFAWYVWGVGLFFLAYLQLR